MGAHRTPEEARAAVGRAAWRLVLRRPMDPGSEARAVAQRDDPVYQALWGQILLRAELGLSDYELEQMIDPAHNRAN